MSAGRNKGGDAGTTDAKARTVAPRGKKVISGAAAGEGVRHPEREERERAAAAALSAELPDALRAIAGNDRVTVRRDGVPAADGTTVVYWMQRAQRGVDNAGLDCAIAVGNALGLPVVVYFAGVSNFPHANLRHYVFLNQGLRDVETDLAKRNVSFVLRNAPREDWLTFFKDVNAAIVIGDENPMRVPEGWRLHVAKHLKVPFWTVDTDVIVPMKRFEKAQYAAYTIRTRLWRMVSEYVEPYENPKALHAWKRPNGFVADDPAEDMTAGWRDLDRSVGAVPDLVGGAHAAAARLKLFVTKMLGRYAETRNHPEVDGTSMLSPYLHYGHISPLRILMEIEAAVAKDAALRESADSFLDEMVTWRELCVNYVKYNPHYDDPKCAEPWAVTTVSKHAHDVRDPAYSVAQMENAETYDVLWNAAQRQMVRRGWMHNYMRMYWAKKILEWSASNAEAMETAIYLNDKYFLDGRDPGGYAGIAWAIYGKFDRPWGERKVFGKIRYMSAASTGKKFKSKDYIAQNT
jgi:deoxyribodipyrimidine photo-lyase